MITIEDDADRAIEDIDQTPPTTNQQTDSHEDYEPPPPKNITEKLIRSGALLSEYFGSPSKTSAFTAISPSRDSFLQQQQNSANESKYQQILQENETAYTLLKRTRLKPIKITGIHPFDLEIRDGILGGDIVEIHGASQSGKTEIAMMLLLNCILPPSHTVPNGNTFTFPGGLGQMVLYFDNDARFNIWRFISILENRVMWAIYNTLHTEDISKEDAFGGEAQYEAFLRSVLSRLVLYRCQSAFSLWVTVLGLMQQQQSNNNTVPYRMVIVDSLNAFYHTAKQDTDRAAKALAQLASRNHTTVVATKSPLYASSSQSHLSRQPLAVPREYLTNEWSQRVTYRLIIEIDESDNPAITSLLRNARLYVSNQTQQQHHHHDRGYHHHGMYASNVYQFKVANEGVHFISS